MPPIIPPSVRRFILTHIDSVPHLEALLLLRAHAPESWSAARTAERLYIGESPASRLLADLQRQAMLSCEDGQYRYAPATDALRGAIDELAAVYASKLVDVTHLIHSRVDRQAQHFADAFRWRKDT